MFRDALIRRRCLIPANNYYEWRVENDVKQPYAFARKDGFPLALAGLWETWKGLEGDLLRTFAIITTDASTEAAPYHTRMPVIVEEADWPLWLGEAKPQAGVHRNHIQRRSRNRATEGGQLGVPPGKLVRGPDFE